MAFFQTSSFSKLNIGPHPTPPVSQLSTTPSLNSQLSTPNFS
jgi:hypothetical protein